MLARKVFINAMVLQITFRMQKFKGNNPATGAIFSILNILSGFAKITEAQIGFTEIESRNLY